jgi:altronate dehydratase large subunit
LTTLRGYRRADGSVGARNHVLVLPSVVCADQTAALISEAGAIAVVHQHGCAQVGDDVTFTERAFVGFASNPNVGGCLVVSLGCETIQGQRVAQLIAGRGQRVEFTGIQLMGGTVKTVDDGRARVNRLSELLAIEDRAAASIEALTVGIETSRATVDRAFAVADAAVAAGARAVIAVSEMYSGRREVERIRYGERASSQMAAVEHAGDGAEQHVGLAGAGAQVIVSIREGWQAPVGCAIAPVIAVAGDQTMYEALEDDFDLGPSASAEEIFQRSVAAFNGERSASERRGARDFILRRIARTM